MTKGQEVFLKLGDVMPGTERALDRAEQPSTLAWFGLMWIRLKYQLCLPILANKRRSPWIEEL